MPPLRLSTFHWHNFAKDSAVLSYIFILSKFNYKKLYTVFSIKHKLLVTMLFNNSIKYIVILSCFCKSTVQNSISAPDIVLKLFLVEKVVFR